MKHLITFLLMAGLASTGTSQNHAAEVESLLKKMTIEESEKMLRKIEHDLEHLNIHHITIQLETPAHKHDNSILCSVKAEPTEWLCDECLSVQTNNL